jgi:hypothetical protein
MRHDIEFYTDSDLKAAIRSEFQLQSVKDECEAELTRRTFEYEREADIVRIHNQR